MNIFGKILEKFRHDPDPVMSEPELANYLNLSFYEGDVNCRDEFVPVITLRQQRNAQLRVPTGEVIACDAFLHATKAFSTVFPKGHWPVILTVMQRATDQRVAFARVQFAESAIAKWKIATTAEQDPAALKPGEIFGFPVDSGTAAFMDASVVKELASGEEVYMRFQDQMMDLLEKTYIHTWSWADMPISGTQGNVVAFSSGDGDGFYPSYVGFDTSDAPVCLVVDFGVFDPVPNVDQ